MGACSDFRETFSGKVYMYEDSSRTTSSTLKHGPKPAMEYIMLQRILLFPIIKKYRGTIIKSIWDSYLASFDDAISCILAAFEISDAYTKCPELIEIYKKSEIKLKSLCISCDCEVAEQVGENEMLPDHPIVVHGSNLAHSVEKDLSLYGITYEKWEKSKTYPKENFYSLRRSTLKDVENLENIVVFCYSASNITQKNMDIIKSFNGYTYDFFC